MDFSLVLALFAFCVTTWSLFTTIRIYRQVERDHEETVKRIMQRLEEMEELRKRWKGA